MKCPKCSYTSFDYNESCPRCGAGLSDVRTLLQIIAVSPEDRAPPAPEARPSDPTEAVEADLAPPQPAAAAVEGDEGAAEDIFNGLDFDESFDDLVERTAHDESPPAATKPKTAEEDLLDLDFGDLFGDEPKKSQ